MITLLLIILAVVFLVWLIGSFITRSIINALKCALAFAGFTAVCGFVLLLAEIII